MRPPSGYDLTCPGFGTQFSMAGGLFHVWVPWSPPAGSPALAWPPLASIGGRAASGRLFAFASSDPVRARFRGLYGRLPLPTAILRSYLRGRVGSPPQPAFRLPSTAMRSSGGRRRPGSGWQMGGRLRRARFVSPRHRPGLWVGFSCPRRVPPRVEGPSCILSVDRSRCALAGSGFRGMCPFGRFRLLLAPARVPSRAATPPVSADRPPCV